jgi:predicted metal-dependent phosphoesterase TrpH
MSIANMTNTPAPVWKVELHSHTNYSKDSLLRLPTFINTCRRRGITRVVVTDHNTIEGALAMAELAPDLVIVGEEIMTTEGELLAYFVRETVPPFLSPQATIDRLRAQGAFISVSHPFDRLRKGAWEEADLCKIIDQVDAIEVFNSRCLYPEDNQKALAFAQANNKPGTVGSDAHSAYELGRATLRLPPFANAQQFGQALRQAGAQTKLSLPLVHVYSKVAKYLNKHNGRVYPGGSA